MHVSNMKLLVDVRQLPASVFEEGFANEDERAREEIEKQHREKDGECPAVLAEKERTIRDEELQFPHEIEGNGQYFECRNEKSVCYHVNRLSALSLDIGRSV